MINKCGAKLPDEVLKLLQGGGQMKD